MNDFWTWAMPYMIKYTFLFFIVLVLSALEVQIESRDGWNKNLPTWKRNNKIYSFLMGGKQLTGYLFYMLIFIFLFLHFPFLNGLEWTIQAEIETLFIFFLFSVFWDFLWFVLNPYYGVRRLKKQYVWWHKKWILNIPLDYPLGLLTALVISLFDFPEGLIKFVLAFGIFSLITIVVIIINEIIRKDPKYEEKHLYYFEKK